MRVLGTMLPKYFIRSAILVAVLFFADFTEAKAQIDQNLQSRFTTFSPPITVLRPDVTAETKQVKTDDTCKPIDDPRGLFNDRNIPKLAADLHNEVLAKRNSLSAVKEPPITEEYFKQPDGTADREKISQLANRPDVVQFFVLNPGKRARFRPFTVQVLPTVFKCGRVQPFGLKISFPFNPTYETNVLKSNTNVHSDSSLGFGGGFLLTGPGIVGRPYDVVGLGVSSASARYSGFLSKSFDLLTEQAIYQIYLDARHIDGTPINSHREEVTNLLTIDTLSLGLVNQTGFMPGYRNETADLLTPQATLARSNIPLSNNFCSTPPAPSDPSKPSTTDANKAPSNIKGLGFCNYLDLALTVGQTFSDVITQQNVNVAGSATLGWRIPDSNWKITLPTVVTARDYENVVGGRRDVLFQIGPVASYTLPSSGNGAPSFIFSMAVTYNQNYSTLSTAAWHGVVVQPTLTMAFQPPPAVK